MAAFWIAALVLLGIAIFMLSYRLWRAPAVEAADEAVDALGVLRDQRRELDGEVAAGRMTADERETRLEELTRRVHDEGLAQPSAAASRSARPARRRAWLAIAISLLVPVIAIPLYLVVGNPAAIDPALTAGTGPSRHGEMTPEQVRVLLDELKARLAKEPDDLKGWTMLGRGLRLVDDFTGSAAAFEKASALSPGDGALLADWADSLGMAQGKSLRGRPSELIQQALATDPRHPKALALAASAEFAEGKYVTAKGYWQRLLAVLPPDSESANDVRQMLVQLDARIAGGTPPPADMVSGSAKGSAQQPPSMSGPGGAAAPSAALAAAGKSASPAPGTAPGSAISGAVKLAPALAAKVAPGDALFIFARAVDGPRMPLAIIRTTAADLPRVFRLDDSQAMAGGPLLSSIARVKIEARISRTGEAMPKPGDLRGESAIVAPGMANVDIVIDTVLP